MAETIPIKTVKLHNECKARNKITLTPRESMIKVWQTDLKQIILNHKDFLSDSIIIIKLKKSSVFGFGTGQIVKGLKIAIIERFMVLLTKAFNCRTKALENYHINKTEYHRKIRKVLVWAVKQAIKQNKLSKTCSHSSLKKSLV